MLKTFEVVKAIDRLSKEELQQYDEYFSSLIVGCKDQKCVAELTTTVNKIRNQLGIKTQLPPVTIKMDVVEPIGKETEDTTVLNPITRGRGRPRKEVEELSKTAGSINTGMPTLTFKKINGGK